MEGLKKHEFDSCLSLLLENVFKKHKALETVSIELQEFMSKIKAKFENVSKGASEELQNEIYQLNNSFILAEEKSTESNRSTYFVDTHETNKAWHKLDGGTKEVLQQNENELFYDGARRPSQDRKDETIQAVQNSKLNKKHKKALIDSIKKKG